MPRVHAPKFTFSTLRFRAKVLILSSLFVTLTLSAYAGYHLYTSIQNTKEQQAYADAMTQADNFSRNAKPQQAVAVLETYLKKSRSADNKKQAMTTLAYAYVQNHQDDKAFTELKAVDNLHINPPSIYVLRSLAWYYLVHKDKAKAISYYRQSITVAESKYDPEATPYVDQWKAQLAQLEAS